MTKGSDIMTRAATLLLDEEHIRWPLSELCSWINEAVGTILLVQPSAYSITMAIPLQRGTLQVLPTTGTPAPLKLLRINRNLASAADSPPVGGRVVTLASQTSLDRAAPYWHSETSVRFKKEVRQFVLSTDDPRAFYVYPGNDGTGVVEAIVSALPPPLVASGDADELASYDTDLVISAIYDAPVLDYVCYRSQLKDDVGAQPGRASMHYQQFANALGIKVQNDQTLTPATQTQRK